uniref:Uncharacterized protein n=1 Tax=Lotharella globosa TaxID=91324 RepID=A0A7S3ZAW3_9EUKA
MRDEIVEKKEKIRPGDEPSFLQKISTLQRLSRAFRMNSPLPDSFADKFVSCVAWLAERAEDTPRDVLEKEVPLLLRIVERALAPLDPIKPSGSAGSHEDASGDSADVPLRSRMGLPAPLDTMMTDHSETLAHSIMVLRTWAEAPQTRARASKRRIARYFRRMKRVARLTVEGSLSEPTGTLAGATLPNALHLYFAASSCLGDGAIWSCCKDWLSAKEGARALVGAEESQLKRLFRAWASYLATGAWGVRGARTSLETVVGLWKSAETPAPENLHVCIMELFQAACVPFVNSKDGEALWDWAVALCDSDAKTATTDSRMDQIPLFASLGAFISHPNSPSLGTKPDAPPAPVAVLHKLTPPPPVPPIAPSGANARQRRLIALAWTRLEASPKATRDPRALPLLRASLAGATDAAALRRESEATATWIESDTFASVPVMVKVLAATAKATGPEAVQAALETMVDVGIRAAQAFESVEGGGGEQRHEQGAEGPKEVQKVERTLFMSTILLLHDLFVPLSSGPTTAAETIATDLSSAGASSHADPSTEEEIEETSSPATITSPSLTALALSAISHVEFARVHFPLYAPLLSHLLTLRPSETCECFLKTHLRLRPNTTITDLTRTSAPVFATVAASSSENKPGKQDADGVARAFFLMYVLLRWAGLEVLSGREAWSLGVGVGVDYLSHPNRHVAQRAHALIQASLARVWADVEEEDGLDTKHYPDAEAGNAGGAGGGSHVDVIFLF